MSFDESGYILYPRTSQTQQVPAYNFQVSIPGWRSSVPKYPNAPSTDDPKFALGTARRPRVQKRLGDLSAQRIDLHLPTDDLYLVLSA